MKIDPSKYRIPLDATIEDVDLDKEEVYLPDGRRLTDELADKLAKEALAAARRRNLIPGRKSLTAPGEHSPVLRFRVPDSVHRRLEERAAKEGKTLSKVAREAVEAYLGPSR